MVEATELLLNGKRTVVRAVAGTPLLHALREELSLKGTRFGCGHGDCGACTVIVDGQARLSCDTAIETVAGATVETVEILGTAEAPAHPLARAVLAEQAAQCGYCLPGILMAAKALLDRNPAPGEAELRAALDGNLCRCGAHLRILRAIRTAAAEMRGAG